MEELPYYIRNFSALTSPIVVPIFKPLHDVEVPLNLWIFAIPGMSQWICLVNDLLSFPKEVLLLDSFNYFSLLTRARRQAGRNSLFNPKDGLWTFKESLYEAFGQLISGTVALDKLFTTFAESLSEAFATAETQAEVNGLTKETNKTSNVDRDKLDNARTAAKLWGEFRQGYIAWHINHPRYRLSSIRATFGETTDIR